jgi:Zn-finger nucleic acid-binding protein
MDDDVCPACGAKLGSVVAYPLMLSACATCGGIWLSNTTANAALRERNPNLLRVAIELAMNATAPSRDGLTDRLCVTCRAPMVRTPMWNERVLIDVCEQHGTFFDPGELEKVLNERLPPPSFSYTSAEELEEFRKQLRAPVFEERRHWQRYPGTLTAGELEQIMNWVFGTLADAFRGRK